MLIIYFSAFELVYIYVYIVRCLSILPDWGMIIPLDALWR